MNELDKYGALLEPTIGLPYSTSGGYGPAGLFISPMADYYTAFAPSAYVNRELIDPASRKTSAYEPSQFVMARPASYAESPEQEKERVALTTADINDYYKVFKNITKRDEPYWPKAIRIEPEHKGIRKDATGIYSPTFQSIALYARNGPAYIAPDIKYVEQAYDGAKLDDSVLPHELAHFVDDRYALPREEGVSSGQPEVPRLPQDFVWDEYAPNRGSTNRAVLLNEMPVPKTEMREVFSKDYEYIYEPYALSRYMPEGYRSQGAPESELYADQLGKAFTLWKNAPSYPKGEQYTINPVTTEDIKRYTDISEKSPIIGLLQKLMSTEAIDRSEIEDAYSQAAKNSVAFVDPSTDSAPDITAGMMRQDEIARAILMGMALNRLQAGTNVSANRQVPAQFSPIFDPASQQTIPIRSVHPAPIMTGDLRPRITPEKK